MPPIRPGSFAAWWRLTRYHYTTSSFLPAAVAGAFAWSAEADFAPERYAIAVAALILNQVALNMTDDYFDFLSGVDRFKDERLHVYTSGSGVLAAGAVSPMAVRAAFTTLFLAGISLMAYLVVSGSWGLIAFMAIGLFYSYFYTAPPVRLAYRGLGEFGFIICFGPLIGAGMAYIATGRFSAEAALVTLPLGLVQFAMICIQEIVDHAEDVAGGKRNLVVRFGKPTGMCLHTLGMAAAFLVVVAAVVVRNQPATLLGVLALVPWAARSIVSYARAYYDPAAIQRLVADFPSFKLHSLLALGLLVPYLVEGLGRGRPAGGAVVVFGVLLVAYLPVVWMLAGTRPPVRAAAVLAEPR